MHNAPQQKASSPLPRVAVIGSGYVGTVVAACLASLGRTVVAVESDPQRLTELRQGSCPFYEPGLDELLKKTVIDGSLRFTSDIGEALAASEVVFLCVGTPSSADGHADMKYVLQAAGDIATHLHSPHVLVTKSTVPIGSGHWLASTIEESYKGEKPIDELLTIVSCPEFLREGSAISDFLHPDRVVAGCDQQAGIDMVAAVYRPILEQSFEGGRTDHRPDFVSTDLLTAETVKYASNAFLAMKISFINEMSTICEMVGADVMDVAVAVGLDTRIGPQFLDAGLGWGGSCFAKDLAELISTAGDYGHRAVLLEAAVEVNRRQRQIVIDKLRRHLKTLHGKRICLLGLAFKAGTDDLRDAPAIQIAQWLLDAGASVRAHDSMVHELPRLPGVRMFATAMEAAESADAVVTVTDWPEYLAIDPAQLFDVMRGRLLIDGRNVFDPTRMMELGFIYEGIGRTTRRAPAKTPKATAAIGPAPTEGTSGPARSDVVAAHAD